MLNINHTRKGKVYYSIKPVVNEVYQILKDVTEFKTHISELPKILQEKKLSQFPELVNKVQLVVEFTDCIVMARDLLSYHIVVDEDPARAARTQEIIDH